MVRLRDDDSAQLLLVGAVALAVVIVSIAVVFNSMVLTASIAPQGTAVAADSAERYERVFSRDAQRLVNRLSTDGETVDRSSLKRNLTGYNRKLAVATASQSPAHPNVSLNGTASTELHKLEQTDNGDVVAASPPAPQDWTMVQSGAVTSFDIWLDPNTPNLPNSEPQAFGVTVANSSAGTSWGFDVWKDASANTVVVEIRQNGSDVSVHQFDPSARIHVDETSIEGATNSTSITFADGVRSPYELDIDYGNKMHANYTVVVDGSVDQSQFADPHAGQPFSHTVLSDVAVDLTYANPAITYESTITLEVGGDPTPDSGATLLYSNFEDGPGGLNSAAWNLTGGGTAGIDGNAAHTGGYAAYHNGVGDGELVTAGTFDTTRFDALSVSFWAQEGYDPTPTGDHGPEPSEGEAMEVQYLDDGGNWVTVETLPANDSATVSYRRELRIDDPGALHSGFRLRFYMPADANSDWWYVDDVTIRGEELP
jgi:hypothetical protein